MPKIYLGLGTALGHLGRAGAIDAFAHVIALRPDFCSSTACRDLLFHVREDAVTLPAVSRFLLAEHVALLGVEAAPTVERAFKMWCGGADDDALRDLLRWDLFEAQHPTCFAGMVTAWEQKPLLVTSSQVAE